jgi:hypothetical protein
MNKGIVMLITRQLGYACMGESQYSRMTRLTTALKILIYQLLYMASNSAGKLTGIVITVFVVLHLSGQ